MRLPNGYGSVYKLSGKRRNPWAVSITTSFTEEGKQVREMLGYFPTKPEALQALAEYHQNPYDIDAAKSTLSEIYEKWYNLTINKNTGESTIKNTKASYKQLMPIHNIPIKELKVSQMQSVLNNCKNGYQSQRKIKQLLNKLYEYCVDNDILKDNPTQRLRIVAKSNETARKRDRISDDTIKRIWDISDTPAAQLALMLIYSGVRVGELLDLKKEDVHLKERYFEVKASKTQSGIRTVPIAEKVYPFWKNFVESSTCSYAVYTTQGKHIVYDNFAKHYWKPLMEKVKADNVIHETRHTCITLLTLANVNPTIIKNIVGHKSAMSLTERVYTHIDIKPLIDAINKI
jgi:integrase